MINWWLDGPAYRKLAVLPVVTVLASLVVLLANSGNSFGLGVVSVLFLVSIVFLVKKQNV